MTTAAFQARFPKPWHAVVNVTTFSIRAANGELVGHLHLSARHSGIPQKEWNRHVAAALKEYLPVEEAR